MSFRSPQTSFPRRFGFFVLLLGAPSLAAEGDPAKTTPVEAPARVVEPPTKPVEPPARVVEPPARTVEPPTRVVEPPRAEDEPPPVREVARPGAPEDENDSYDSVKDEADADDESSVATKPPHAPLHPYFRWGLNGAAGPIVDGPSGVNLGFSTRFGTSVTKNVGLTGGTTWLVPVVNGNSSPSVTFWGFTAQFEYLFADVFYLGGGPALVSATAGLTNVAPGFVARGGYYLGARNREGRGNAISMGFEILVAFRDTGYAAPVFTIGYERF